MTALSEERLDELLAYCKLTELKDDPEVQRLIPSFYADAVGYMNGSGINEPQEGTERRAQYDLCVNAMVLDSWDHRDMKEPANQVTENAAFRRKLNQLKFSEGAVSKLDTAP